MLRVSLSKETGSMFERIGIVVNRCLAGLALLIAAGEAAATAYTFPGTLPSGCSGSSGTYTCSALTLNYNDTISIASPTPATINVNGAFSTNNAKINTAGSAANLTINVNGALSATYQAVINANVTAASVTDSGTGTVTFAGSITSTGSVALTGSNNSVSGTITTTTGSISIGGTQSNVDGSIISTSGGSVNVGYLGQVGGSISTSGTISIGQSATVSGNIIGSSGKVSIGYAATVLGTVTTSSGAIDFAQSASASSCVKSTGSASITLGYQAAINSVCCGSSCGTSCITNNSTYGLPPKCSSPAQLIAEYRFDECTQYTDSPNEVMNYLSPTYSGTPKSGLQNSAAGKIGRLANFSNGNIYADISNGPTLTNWTISVWFKTPFNSSSASHNIQYYVLGSVDGGGDFIYLDNTGGNFLWGVYTVGAGAGKLDGTYQFSSLTAGWHHLAVVGKNSKTSLYIDGVYKDQVSRKTSGTFRYLGASYDNAGTSIGQSWGTPLDEFKIFDSPLTASEIATIYNNENAGLNYDGSTRPAVCLPSLHHVRLNHTGTGITCSGSSITINACNDSDTVGTCTPETSGFTGNVVAGSITVPFTIAAGSSSTTVTVPVTTAQTVTLATSGLSTTPGNSTTCWNGSSASCSHIFSDSGFIFNVPNHVAEVSQTVNVSAVRKSDNSLACTPAFASVSKSVTFRCSYFNPVTGTLPVRVNGNALNSANSAAAACDATGRAASLAFNASGVASTTFQYADVGNMSLTATYTGSGADAGLSMTGSDTFITSPKDFAFSGITAAPIKAGNNFSATVTARNNANNATPNFGKETPAEGATLAFVKYQPTGTGAVNGSFSGTLGTFSGGAAIGSNLNWSEVGTIDLNATLTSGSYLGAGFTATGSTGSAGGVGRFIPDHFDSVVTQGCSTGSFTYSAQPFTVQVTARNLSGGKTQNYDGSSNTSPNFSEVLTLSDANSVAGGSLAPTSILSSAFAAGVASATPAFTFTSATTSPASIRLRAIDTDNVASSVTEGIANIRSGRIRLENAYGSELLRLPIALERNTGMVLPISETSRIVVPVFRLPVFPWVITAAISRLVKPSYR